MMIGRMGSQQMIRDFLSNLETNQGRLSVLQNQLSSGKRVNSPGDDPVAVGRALNLRSDQTTHDAWKANISDGLGWLQTTDVGLDNMTKLIQRANELTVQGGNGTLSNEARALLSKEVLALRDQVAEVGNASLGGRYIFGGTATNTAPFSTAPPGLIGPANTGQLNREVGQGQVVGINTTADRLVDPAGATPDLFATLTTISTALLSSDLTTLSNQALTELGDHLNNINSLRGEVGAKINRMELTVARYDLNDISRAQISSEIEDVDIAQAITELKSRESLLRSSMAVGSRVIQPSLVDFLG
jgi:flagellar hook-associated protein 3 FlgL